MTIDDRLRSHGFRIHGRPARGPVTWQRKRISDDVDSVTQVLTQADAILACDLADELRAYTDIVATALGNSTAGGDPLGGSGGSGVDPLGSDDIYPPFRPRKPKRRKF